MTYHYRDGLAYSERQLGKQHYSAMRVDLPSLKRVFPQEWSPRYGSLSLCESSVRVAARHIESISIEAFVRMPWHLTDRILRFANSPPWQVSLKAWAKALLAHKGNVTPAADYNAEAQLTNLSDLPELLYTDTTAWLTVVNVCATAVKYADMISLAQLPSLAILQLRASSSSDAMRVDDSVFWYWSRMAETHAEILRRLRVVQFIHCGEITVKTLHYLKSMRRLQRVYFQGRMHMSINQVSIVQKDSPTGWTGGPTTLLGRTCVNGQPWIRKQQTRVEDLAHHMSTEMSLAVPYTIQIDPPVLSLKLGKPTSCDESMHVFSRTAKDAKQYWKQKRTEIETVESASKTTTTAATKRAVKKQKLQDNGLDDFL